MHVSYWLIIIGVVGYLINAVVIWRFVKGLQKQIQSEVREERRKRKKSERDQDGQWGSHEKVIKENPGYKWTMHVGTLMFLVCAFGVVWTLLRLVRLLP